MLIIHSKLYQVNSYIYLKVELVQFSDTGKFEIRFFYIEGRKQTQTNNFDFLNKNLGVLDSYNAKKMNRRYYYILEKIKKTYPNLEVI